MTGTGVARSRQIHAVRDFALDSGRRLSLRFGAGTGSDDENYWLDRRSRLLPPDPAWGARVRR